MRYSVEFKFRPKEYVKIVLFDLQYAGRVDSCRAESGDVKKYLVEYADDKGDLQTREFYEDELCES